jgi:hypothetical protein
MLPSPTGSASFPADCTTTEITQSLVEHELRSDAAIGTAKYNHVGALALRQSLAKFHHIVVFRFPFDKTY